LISVCPGGLRYVSRQLSRKKNKMPLNINDFFDEKGALKLGKNEYFDEDGGLHWDCTGYIYNQ
jgi:hypothetical protein